VNDVTLQLRADVFVAETDGVFVFLDLERDRYCAVSRSDSERLMDLMREGWAPHDPLIGRLRAAGLLADEAGGRPFATTPACTPEQSLPPAARLGPIVAFRGAVCRACARRALKTKHIRDIVEARRTRRCALRLHADQAHVMRLAGEFAAGRPFAGGRDACLSEALALTFYLGCAGAAAEWVFGVKALPFAAHCWVQAGGLVLNDTVENVRNYTPIMIA
jgi:hypothetical protein